MSEGAPRELVKLTISLLSDGQVTVNGPLTEKMQCYGMLECARDAIREYKSPVKRIEFERIQPPVNGVPK